MASHDASSEVTAVGAAVTDMLAKLHASLHKQSQNIREMAEGLAKAYQFELPARPVPIAPSTTSSSAAPKEGRYGGCLAGWRAVVAILLVTACFVPVLAVAGTRHVRNTTDILVDGYLDGLCAPRRVYLWRRDFHCGFAASQIKSTLR